MAGTLVINKSGKVPKRSCIRRFVNKTLTAIRLIVFAVVRLICSLYYTDKKPLPPVKNSIILESTMSLAEKIRTKKV